MDTQTGIRSKAVCYRPCGEAFNDAHARNFVAVNNKASIEIYYFRTKSHSLISKAPGQKALAALKDPRTNRCLPPAKRMWLQLPAFELRCFVYLIT